MTALFIALLAALRATIRSRLELTAETLALRHQLAVLQRTTPKRPRLRPIDRLVWMLLSSVWPNWQSHGDLRRPWLPLAVHAASASPAEVRLVEDTLHARFFQDFRPRLIGEIYSPFDPELPATRMRARDLRHDVNTWRASEQRRRDEFGKSRTLSRRFREHVGMTPARSIARSRMREAQWLLETTTLSVEAIA
jgi:AraC-like DNA-binding protein